MITKLRDEEIKNVAGGASAVEYGQQALFVLSIVNPEIAAFLSDKFGSS